MSALLEVLIAVGIPILVGSLIYTFINVLDVYFTPQSSPRKKIYSKRQWRDGEFNGNSCPDKEIALSYESFKQFVLLNPEGWSWPHPAGIYKCNPVFVYNKHSEVCLIRFKTYRDYVKAVRFWEERIKEQERRAQELKEAKNMASFLAEMKRRAKEAEEQADKQMSESERQVKEILECLKSESVIPTLTPSAPSASVSVTGEGKIILSGSPDKY